MTHRIQQESVKRRLVKLAAPIFVETLLIMMLGAVDTIMLSRHSDSSVAAVGVVNQIIMLTFLVFEVINLGTSVLCSQYLGAKLQKKVVQVVGVSLLVNLVVGGVISLFLCLMNTTILGWMGLGPELMADGADYMRIVGAFAFFQAISLTLSASLRSANKAIYPMLVTVVVNILNIIGNYSLIFGKFGFPQLGIAGAAIGSSLAELVSVIFFIIYTWKRIDCKKYALNILPKFQSRTLKRILNVSVWTMIQNFVSLSTWFMFFLFVEHLGERSLAIANIIRNVSGIPFMIAMAFAATCGSLVSNLIGAGEKDCVRGTINQHIRIGYVFVLPILIFFCLFPDLILRIYTDMPDLRDASIPSLWVLCAAYVVLVPANVYFQSVSGTGNTRTALAMELCVLTIYVAYATYFILYLKMDIAFAWTTESVYGIFILLFCYWYMKKGNWQKKKI